MVAYWGALALSMHISSIAWLNSFQAVLTTPRYVILYERVNRSGSAEQVGNTGFPHVEQLHGATYSITVMIH